jgi:hypothetical protein
MGKYDDRRIVECPECKCVLFSEDIARHFAKTHCRELSTVELLDMLDHTRQHPVAADRTKAFLERLYELDEKRDKLERTPRSMQQWEGGAPREGMRSGPLGPGRG